MSVEREEMWKQKQSEIISAQDQALQTKYYETKIVQTETDSKCRLCQQYDDTREYIISVHPIVTKEQYIHTYRDKIVCVCVCVCVCARARVRLFNCTLANVRE